MPSDMNIKYLRSFLAFVEERSTAKAAYRLGIARHNIGMHVLAVEKTVGERLLEKRYPREPRETGRTQLTAAGQTFYPKALRTLQAHDAMFDAEETASDPLSERLAIASGLLELALDATRNNLSDADQALLNKILLDAELKTSVSTGRLRSTDQDAD